MKAMTSVLFSSLLFLFNCEEEATSVELPEDIDVGIRFKLADLSQNHALCKKKYEVEFWVDNCAGGRSSTMSYTYLGCVELNGICFV